MSSLSDVQHELLLELIRAKAQNSAKRSALAQAKTSAEERAKRTRDNTVERAEHECSESVKRARTALQSRLSKLDNDEKRAIASIRAKITTIESLDYQVKRTILDAESVLEEQWEKGCKKSGNRGDLPEPRPVKPYERITDFSSQLQGAFVDLEDGVAAIGKWAAKRQELRALGVFVALALAAAWFLWGLPMLQSYMATPKRETPSGQSVAIGDMRVASEGPMLQAARSACGPKLECMRNRGYEWNGATGLWMIIPGGLADVSEAAAEPPPTALPTATRKAQAAKAPQQKVQERPAKKPAGKAPAASSRGPFDVSISSSPPGASVAINRTVRGRTPLSLRLAAGTYGIRLTKNGYAPTIKMLKVSRGNTRFSFPLQRAK